MSKTKSDAWQPAGVTLEDAALVVVKSDTNKLVVAGPGAGKTELLAQRASFLLETGLCAAPFRILAISFKRDAATNLEERVIRRCGRERAQRFDSMTFDAFSKDLLDRFRLALPEAYQPSADYLVLTNDYNARSVWESIQALPAACCPLTGPQREQIRRQTIVGTLTARPLPLEGWPQALPNDIAAAGLWRHWLKDTEPSRLAFPMIGRLADFLLRTNPALLEALRKTYRYVFLDEFQDGTAIQYALTKTCFAGSDTVVTAVGDNKQRIMRWAGATTDIFEKFEADFGATTEHLVQNHRSVSKLVGIQQFFADLLDEDAPDAVSARASSPDDGECRAWAFPHETIEATYLTARIKEWIEEGELKPRDICILTRMRSAQYCEALIARLAEAGIAARVEDPYQRILFEPGARAVLDILALATSRRAPEAWEASLSLLADLASDHEQQAMRKLAQRLLAFIRECRSKLTDAVVDEAGIRGVLDEIVAFYGREALNGRFPQYGQGDFFEELLEQLTEFLVAARARYDWSGAVKEVIGENSIPILTIHKSKGLEFDTVVFLGLEDDAFFGYADNPDEETCGLFVALSRAKNRAIFTFSAARPWSRYPAKSRGAILTFYQLFAEAGVNVEEVVG